MPTSLGLVVSNIPQDVTDAGVFGANSLVTETSYSAQNIGNRSVYVGEQESSIDVSVTVPYANTVRSGESQLINPTSGFTIYIWTSSGASDSNGLLVCNEIT